MPTHTQIDPKNTGSSPTNRVLNDDLVPWPTELAWSPEGIEVSTFQPIVIGVNHSTMLSSSCKLLKVFQFHKSNRKENTFFSVIVFCYERTMEIIREKRNKAEIWMQLLFLLRVFFCCFVPSSTSSFLTGTLR